MVRETTHEARPRRLHDRQRRARPAGEKADRPEREQREGRRRSRKKVLGRVGTGGAFAVVQRAWAGHAVVILGGGPSLTSGDGLARVKSARSDREGRPLSVIAVNNAYQVAPNADVLYYADGRWWSWHKDRDDYRAFQGLRCSIEGSDGEGAGDPDVYRLQLDATATISRDPTRLAHGGNGGYQAINLAALAGAKRIILLGYDMKHDGKRTNWHAGHPIRTRERIVRNWIPNFRRLAVELANDGVEVINASEDTALDAFPRRPIAELLPDPEAQ